MALRIKLFPPHLTLSRFLHFPRFHHHPNNLPLSESEEDAAVVSGILTHLRSSSRWRAVGPLLPEITPSQISLITLHLRNSPRLALALHRRLPRPSLPSLSSLALVLARHRLLPPALSALRSALLLPSHHLLLLRRLSLSFRAFSSSPLVFDLLVRAHLLHRRPDRALLVARILLSRGTALRPRTFAALLLAHSADRAALLHSRLSPSRPSIRTFNALLECFRREGRTAEKMAELRAQMDASGCHPDSHSYRIWMAGLGEEGRAAEALQVWEEMGRSGLRRDAAAYRTLIAGLCNAGEVRRAEEVFGEMVVAGMDPTGAAYECLIHGHCSAGDTGAAWLLYVDMRRKGLALDVGTVEKLVSVLAAAEGLKVLRNEMRRVEFCASRACYVGLIRGFCEEGEVEEALKLQLEMVGRGFEPDLEVYDAFMRGYLKRGELGKVEMLKSEMSEFLCSQS